MKLKLATLLIAGLFANYTVADGCNKDTKKCSPESPFDVANVNFVSQATSVTKPPAEFNNPFDCRVANFCFGEQVAISSQALSLIQGMAKYAEEYSDWADAMEWYQDYLHVQDINADLSDNIAWAILAKDTHIRIQLEGDSRTRTYRPGRIISGSDWNNNGKIDSIEVVSGFKYYSGVIETH